VAARFVCLLAFLVGAFCVGLWVLEGYRAATSKKWPVTQATVIAFRATPNYQYSVGGGTYVSDNVSCNELFGWSKVFTDSEKYAVRYPLNAKVTVHYHPTKPDIGVLETKFDAAIFWKQLGIIIVVTVMFGVAALSPGLRWKSA
jgi:hypothetical protein